MERATLFTPARLSNTQSRNAATTAVTPIFASVTAKLYWVVCSEPMGSVDHLRPVRSIVSKSELQP